MPIYIWYPAMAGLAMGFVNMNIPPAMDRFMSLFGVGYGGLAFFLSALIWAHSLAQIPAGMAVDRLGVFRLLLLATGVGAAAGFLPLAAPANLALAIVCRCVIGLCTAVFFLAILKIIGFLAPEGRMSGAQGIYGGLFGLGTMSPYVLLPFFGEKSWAYSYGVGGALFFLMFLLAFLLPREKLRLPLAGRGGQGLRFRDSIAAAAKSKPVWALGLLHGFSYGTMTNLGQWLPSVLADLSKGDIGAWALAATFVLLIGSVARSISGWLVRFSTRASLINRAIAAIACLYLLLALSGSAWATLVLGLILAFLCGVNYGSIFTMGSWILPAAYMGTALGLMNMIANLTNVLLTILLGNVREHTGSFRIGLFVAGLAAAAVWLSCRRLVAGSDRALERNDMAKK